MNPPNDNRGSSSKMTDEHKAALAKGRAEGRAVKAYLDALVANRPKRGRRRTEESITKQLDRIESELADASPIKSLQLIQERIDLSSELESLQETVDISTLEDAFVKVAADYSERKGISYAAWREIGVEPSVLSRAGVKRGS
jgi:uncharacterized protein YicC (UPF0701 family)